MTIGRVMWAPETQGGQAPSGTTQSQREDTRSGDNSTPPAGGSGGRTFTQEQIEAIIGERARHARSAAINDLLGELGVEKADELKALVKAAKDRQASEQTELQRLQAQLADYQKREAQWAQEKRAQALQLAVQAAAQKLGIVDPEVALALIGSGIEYDEAGTPQGVEARLAELVRAKPYLKAQTGGGGSPTNPPRAGATLSMEAIAKMTPTQINDNWDAVKAALEKRNQ